MSAAKFKEGDYILLDSHFSSWLSRQMPQTIWKICAINGPRDNTGACSYRLMCCENISRLATAGLGVSAVYRAIVIDANARLAKPEEITWYTI